MTDDLRTDGGAAKRDRYAAIVAALLDVRSDDATSRFDDEVTKAVADDRLDASTARTLRWWQRTSVRAAESYAAAVVSDLLAARDHAEATARREAEEAANTWAATRALTANVDLATAEPTAEPTAEQPDDEPAPAEQPDDEAAPAELPVADLPVAELPVAELAAVRLLTPRARTPESTRAIRVALASNAGSSSADANDAAPSGMKATAPSGMKATAPSDTRAPAPWTSTDLVTTTISTDNPSATKKPAYAPPKGKDPGHANPATSA